ncbi:hypothetical protein CR203_08845 [Salipaludibacillus neizhouensis]|uniref:Uncharacterized protein n=1 Tax=Salipaludibacillus neizhouensis TaxID=885475 RepID=A0A3A9K2T8_9BACI|nr:hypothetical protein [Salipaludibacillus neizhouensis]RKL67454.1 hypothetical protein CR203_08845 [Salipaludibacillus neizhouensis]
MSPVLAVILGIAVLVILLFVITKSIKGNRSKSADDSVLSQNNCSECDFTIPDNYSKALCPNCKTFIAK